MLKNNCMSCHNKSPSALARSTGFALDPKRTYRPAELAAQLQRRGLMMGPETQALLDVHEPGTSEILLRLEGRQGRRRMPPVEGGVATTHDALIHAIHRWAVAMAAQNAGHHAAISH